MATYKEAGVDIDLGDECSKIAYEAAKGTFPGRKGMIGEPVIDDGGFSGALDMGDHYLVQNSDTVGTKIVIAEKIQKFDTLGYDLLAMVADDAVCMGAETISITNTIDVNRLNKQWIAEMMSGLKAACLEQKVAIAGGEICESGPLLNSYIWGATALGVLEKNKMITGENITPGDQIIGLASDGLRSNGFTLARHILKNNYGEAWHNEPYQDNHTWGQALLTPARIYSNLILALHGRYGQPANAELKGVVHVTGGGIPGNIERVLKKSGLGAKLDNLPQPHAIMQKLQEMGQVESKEAYRTWNMGVGMIVISSNPEPILNAAKEHNIGAQVIGQVQEGPLEIDYK